MERFINILIIDNNPVTREGLATVLLGNGNNVLTANNTAEALPIIQNKEIGVLLINIDDEEQAGMELLRKLKEEDLSAQTYKIIVTKAGSPATLLVRGFKNGAVDFITTPFNPNIVKAKLDVYKTMFYKDQRIGQLLANIFPAQVIEDFNTYGKVSPKRIQNGVVLFTDFVDFSAFAKGLEPIELLKKLERHFNAFDQIAKRYAIEKIKTIGDAYMALAGVNENKAHPAIRACMAALEMRHYIEQERRMDDALGKNGWDVRIGMHMGPLVAGVIGQAKYSYDVWGDTVNIAARAESSSKNGEISITETIAKAVSNYFEIEPIGEVDLEKRGGVIHMYALKNLRLPFSMDSTQIKANAQLRTLCELDPMDFDNMRSNIIGQLKAMLPEEYQYHDLEHTLAVEKAARRLAKLEGVNNDDLLLLRTAALYHDAGFIFEYENNEKYAVELAKNQLPQFGYSTEQIQKISQIIMATQRNWKPKNLLEEIIRDADHDYLGRVDYRIIVKKLRAELKSRGIEMEELQWNEFQLKYLEEQHQYFTITAKNLRNLGKINRILEIKHNISKLKNESIY